MKRPYSLRAVLALLALTLGIPGALAAPELADISQVPLGNSGGSGVRPNMMFILDDSGSMNREHMPDTVTSNRPGYCLDSRSPRDIDPDACGPGDPPYHSSAFNTQFYDPQITYTPPLFPLCTGATPPADCASRVDPAEREFPSYNTPASWEAVKTDPYTGNATINLLTQFPDLRFCERAARAADPVFYAGLIDNPDHCRKNGVAYPLGGQGITALPAAAAVAADYNYPNSNANAVAERRLDDPVPLPSILAPGVPGIPHYYRMDRLRDVATPGEELTGINALPAADRPSVVYCKQSITVVGKNFGFGRGAFGTDPTTAGCINKQVGDFKFVRYGKLTRVEIIPGNAPFPGPNGTTRTYDEEMTNFANWYAYYRTRLLMMKSAVGRAFANVGDSYRIGFITINQHLPDNSFERRKFFVPLDTFNGRQRGAWYAKLYSVTGSPQTPLREALANVGRYYAGVYYPGTGGAPSGPAEDPVQFSCQQNFSILSTDGYWNDAGTGKQVDGSAIANHDTGPAVPRPINDGGLAGSSGTLADVAAYYYQTDLRTNNCNREDPARVFTDVCANNVPQAGVDVAAHQHMTTFTLSLGLDGELTFRPDYQSATVGDFAAIQQGSKNWPEPVADAPTALDDLWHAAVNGRGVYFSAKNPENVSEGLSGALAGVSARTGAAAAAATSSLEPVAGDNFAYGPAYRTEVWDGKLEAFTIDLTNGTIDVRRPIWNAANSVNGLAQQRTDPRADPARTPNVRKIFMAPSVSSDPTDNEFLWDKMNVATQNLFEIDRTRTVSQRPDDCGLPRRQCWNDDKRDRATRREGKRALVNYIRGNSDYEDRLTNDRDFRWFRARENVLGDIVNSQPVFVRKPPFSYGFLNYSGYRGSQDGRDGRVYVGANDGMLHAFDADDGVEAWAYVPSLVMPNLYKLSDFRYSTQHEWFVDGSPVVGDVYDTAAGAWKTILVGGLNGGGRGYYALDVTNPAAPQVLWEFKSKNTNCSDSPIGLGSDCDLGLTYGNPVITRLDDDPSGERNSWVVIVSSGYNNVAPGDGQGHIYVLDAIDGTIKKKLSTTASCVDRAGTDVDCVEAPRGLAKISAYAPDPLALNVAKHVYGADLQGNLWRFDINGILQGSDAYLMAVLKDPSGSRQPVTTRPEVGDIPVRGGSKIVVFVGTGRYIGASDPGDTTGQSIYAIRDDLVLNGDSSPDAPDPNAAPVDPRGGSMVKQTITERQASDGSLVRFGSNNAVDFHDRRGWFVDLPLTGERVNVDMQLQLGTLVVASNIPDSNSCNVGGFSWINFFDYLTGGPVSMANGGIVGRRGGNSLIVGLNIVKLPNGKIPGIATTSAREFLTAELGFKSPPPDGRRVSWREIIQ